jgi:hypothetical protein
MKLKVIAATATVAGASILASLPVQAGCHLIDCVEDVYVQPKELKGSSCETLWILRNSIYDDAGYCFKTERGKAFFINDGCTHTDIQSVPLNDYQRHNVKVLAKMEAKSGC